MTDLELATFKLSLEQYLNAQENIPHGVKAMVLETMLVAERQKAETAIRQELAQLNTEQKEDSQNGNS